MKPDFEKTGGLIPAIIQDYFTKNVLMLGYMNEEAFEMTIKQEKVTFFSRSKNRLWTKGETSGHFLYYKSCQLDCDRDTLLVQAIPSGPACHLNTDTCFSEEKNTSADLGFLEKVIINRKKNPSESSYTNKLLANPLKAAQKVGEEAVETVIEAVAENDERFREEAADLLYHYLVLLHTRGQSMDDVINILRHRFKE
ncbi:MAG: bifunctional phosphoribosyl-AMP cyclohydrolase/phosphoribosyl-ATP diphosphatase HisIE [Cyclobacteriaceae bacterium]|nr:bifunctional phosphoribosyl-AMP cyclohydrolase/phosphoribosyl-ATP diphosphatase HisIE [Cyclobacteriaceae bacterium]